MTIEPDLRDKIIETHTIVAALKPVVQDHEERIRKQEVFRQRIYGVVAGTGAVFAAFFDYARHFWKG